METHLTSTAPREVGQSQHQNHCHPGELRGLPESNYCGFIVQDTVDIGQSHIGELQDTVCTTGPSSFVVSLFTFTAVLVVFMHRTGLSVTSFPDA